VFDNQTKDDVVDDFLNASRNKLASVSGFDPPVVYVNFAHGDEGPAAWYGQRNLERLGRLKQIWDPKRLFSFYNAVPLPLD
jgi:hypothetical protein